MKMDKQTKQIAAELIAKYDAAVKAEDLPTMERIVADVCASPNQPLRWAVMKELQCGF